MIESAPSVAVIGSGISGMAASWLLSQRYQVTLIEQNAYLGGHTNTIEVGSERLPVDTGFIVFNKPNYPHFTAMLEYLGVAYQPTDMSFSASINQGQIEYAGSNLWTLFAQPSNLFRPSHWRMLRDIVRFNNLAKQALAGEVDDSLTLGEFLDLHGIGEECLYRYLLPMAAAIWSCPVSTMLAFPARSFIRFFENHGLLNIEDRPQWYTLVGGSYQYIKRILGEADFAWMPSSPVTSVRRSGDKHEVCFGDHVRHFDHVVFACHADQALAMLDQGDEALREVLGAFRFQKNRAVLHTDKALMPRRKAVWSAWNYLARVGGQENDAVAVTYWMNLLQNLKQPVDYLVSLNPFQEPAADKVIADMQYEHPVFDSAALNAQQQLPSIQGLDQLWFCGAWTGFGFHEDGLRSAVTVARAMGCTPPWDESGDLHERSLALKTHGVVS